MINTSELILDKIAVHYVGNKNAAAGIRQSQSLLELDELVQELLLKYFLSPFKTETFYNFSHPSDIELNEVYSFASQIFENTDTFLDQSVNIARHLYDCSNHPKIKAGEFYAVYFKDILIDDELVDAIGLFKSENKDIYLKVYQKDNNYQINSDIGININRLDKGCLIFNTEKDLGFKVALVDNTNKGEEAQFWKDYFLKVKNRKDNFYFTQNHMEVVSGFVEEVFNQDNNIPKTQQIDVLKKSVDYFKQNEDFKVEDFEKQVMIQPEIIESFQNYKREYAADNQIELRDGFNIAPRAVSQAQKFFKGRSVIKLDKNFSLYVHGEREFIEKGWDDTKRMHFYKVFFMEEY
ncbi:MAG: nucleoid-associated protein [Bacteroidales bacterium]|nr:nucleoid-associated protein [Bacteroidales bacterium]